MNQAKQPQLRTPLLTSVDAPMRELLKQLAGEHSVGRMCQTNKGRLIGRRYNEDTGKDEVSLDGKTWTEVTT